MNEPINLVLLMLVIIASAGAMILAMSPDAEDILARKMRARARAQRASRAAWRDAYHRSMSADIMRDKENAELEKMVR